MLVNIAAAGLILVLPGLAWQTWFPRPEQDAAERLADAVGLSISFTALVALGFYAFNVRITGAVLWILYFSATVIAILGMLNRWRKSRRVSPLPEPAGEPQLDPGDQNSQGHLLGILIPLIVLGLVISAAGWRLYQARTLVLPAWVDSLHHVLIVRKIVEAGGLPQDLTPYLPVPFYYHYGFHVLAALFSVITHSTPDQAVLWLGQVINALVGLSVYRLGKTVWGKTFPALAAALLVAFVSHMPAYYVTWGRYTLLAGLVMLPLGMAQALEILRFKPDTPRFVVLRSSLYLGWFLAGMTLAHYMTLFLWGLYALFLAASCVITGIKIHSWTWLPWSAWVAGGAGGLFLTSPWLWRVWLYANQKLVLNSNLYTSPAKSVYSPDYLNYLWYLLGPDRGHFLLYLGGAGLVFGFWRRSGRELAAWGALLAIQTVPWGWHLHPFRPDHYAILLFLPVTLLIGGLLWETGVWAGWLVNRIPTVPDPDYVNGKRSGLAAWVQYLLPVSLLTALCIWGLRETGNILNPTTLLADADDLPAMQWIDRNIPQNARFFINTAYWQGGNYRPTDGGGWILPLAGRWALIPTIFYGFGDPALSQQINRWSEQAAGLTGCTPEFWTLVESAKLTHMYLREGKGALQPGGMANCPGIKLVYQQGGVYIYALEPLVSR